VKSSLIALLLLATLISGAAFAGQIDQLKWNQSNIATLRSFDEAAVEKFVNEMSEGDVHKTVGEFTWADLAGDGRYELVTTLDLSGRSFFEYLAVYQRDDSGSVSVQWFPEETAIGKLNSVIRDLDNDGRKELIIPTLYFSGSYGAGSVGTAWPAVYKLKNGLYVEASNEFGKFYDTDVLPGLVKDIAEERAKAGTSASYSPTLISQTLERDKILRVLGRDQTAGLNEAREWASSDNPNLARAGAAVLREINGNARNASREKELPKVVVLRKSSAR
jgi:hypothetical protein